MSSQDLDAQVAVVGFAGRFPGADGALGLWRNLVAGTGGLRDITAGELVAAGVPAAAQADPRYVRRGAPLDDVDLFDAEFFGYAPHEAELMDPQHRLFLECCWEALEFAGYPPTGVPGKIGVFGGVAPSVYGMRHLLMRPEVMAGISLEQYAAGTSPDAFCATVAHKLGLTGPVVGVQTNCSTSLVAVHLAVQGLLTYDCDAALAGAAALADPLPVGYRFAEGTLVSPDGRIRSFDEAAEGTVYGNGAGVVLLKRMADALADGDHVWGVILGTAVNNDGAARARFGTPGVEGQAAVMSYALTVAGVDPRDVDYVECHAPGTMVGDSVELAALAQAYAGRPAGRRVLSSLKPDTGYLDRAAGVAGLIKALQALHHRVLPATRGFRRPNRAMDTARFEVLERDRPWPRPDGHPRLAGVGAFGVGGTNAHIIVREAPTPEERPSESGPQALVFSARTPSALRTVIERFAAWLSAAGPVDLGDVAHTLQQSRSGFACRAAVVVHDRDEALRALADPGALARVDPVVAAGAAVVPAGARAAADLWLAGADVSFSALHDGHRRRVPLPTYPFERRRHFLDRPDVSAVQALLEGPRS